MIQAIIFDCFGVLVGQGFDTTWRRAGGDPVRDREFITDMLGAANLGIVSSTEMQSRVCARLGITPAQWQEAVAQTQAPDTELLDYIASLKPHYKVAILSNANIGTLERKFSPEQLELFDTVVVSAEVGLIKPDRRIYELAAERLGVNASACLFTDDSEYYCQAARDAGMQAIHYQSFEQFRRDLGMVLNHT